MRFVVRSYCCCQLENMAVCCNKLFVLKKLGPVAQRLEQWTRNPLVVGSNPTGPNRFLPPKTAFPARNSRFLMSRISLYFCNTLQINAIKWRSNGGVNGEVKIDSSFGMAL